MGKRQERTIERLVINNTTAFGSKFQEKSKMLFFDCKILEFLIKKRGVGIDNARIRYNLRRVSIGKFINI